MNRFNDDMKKKKSGRDFVSHQSLDFCRISFGRRTRETSISENCIVSHARYVYYNLFIVVAADRMHRKNCIELPVLLLLIFVAIFYTNHHLLKLEFRIGLQWNFVYS